MMLRTRLFVAFTFMVMGSVQVFAQSGSTSNAINPLERNRKKIDSLDRQLIELLGQRERVVKEIGIYKAKNNIPPLQAARFQQVLEKNITAGKTQDLSPEFVTEIFNAIHKESLKKEEELKAVHSQN